METVGQVLGYLNIVVFTALAIVAVRQWLVRRDRAAKWAAISFGALGVVVLSGAVVPEDPDAPLEHVVQRIDVACLLLFPYLLYRFTKAFRPPSWRLERFVSGMTIVMLSATFLLPSFPESGASRPWWFQLYLAGFLVHWGVLSVAVTARLWAAGRRQPGVGRRRMEMLALASLALTLAIFLVAAAPAPDSAAAVFSQLLGFVSAVAFFLGLAPPSVVRALWRRTEQRRVQEAIQSLVAFAPSGEEVAGRVLEPMAAMVGARAIALHDPEGEVIGFYERDQSGGSEELHVPFEGGSVRVWTSPYAPFFGEDELALLRTLAALTGIALDRARLFERERELRVQLERADELKSHFIALAAHELRTPVTTIHGFVHTLHHLGDRIDETQREDLKRALEQQTERMAMLVEQLLDLSRLDAEAIDVVPQRFNVRERLDAIVTTAAGDRSAAVDVRVDSKLEANADPAVVERVVTNLVTNALRYGAPPVTVEASQSDRHFRIAVEDRGDGVPAEFVPDLFERFSRGDESRRQARGTGLGLAIARSYARAHRGDLLYHPADPRGARFELVLPAEAVAAAT